MSCDGSVRFMRIAKYNPAGPPPMMLIFMSSQIREATKGAKDAKEKNPIQSGRDFFCAFCAFSWLFLQKLARNHQFLNLRRAFINSQRADVAIEAFDDAATNQARAAVNLHRVVDYSASRFGREKFCFARFARDAISPRIFQICSPIDEQPRGVKLSCHVSQLLLDQLMFGEQPAELFARARIAQRFI